MTVDIIECLLNQSGALFLTFLLTSLLMFLLPQLEAPSLTPQEADTLRLLATLAAAPRPAPFPGISRPLPGSYPGPPPPIQQVLSY